MHVNAGDTAWMLTSTALVLFMADMHNYLSAGMIFEPRLDFLTGTGQRTIIVDSYGCPDNQDCPR